MIKAIRTLALGLGLFGSAALTGIGPLIAHAKTPYLGPIIYASVGNCDAYITGSKFKPSGTVDMYVSESGSYTNSFEITLTATPGLLFPPYGLIGGGNISRDVVIANQTAETVQVQAYDTASKQWSNVTVSSVTCIN